MWEGAEDVAQEVKGGSPIKVAAIVERFREQRQVRISRLRAAGDEEISRADMMPTTDRDVEVMKSVIREAVEGIQDEHLSRLVRCFYDDPAWAERFESAPAARRIHHAYLAGMLEHVYELLVLARPLLELYPEIRRDLFIAGILLARHRQTGGAHLGLGGGLHRRRPSAGPHRFGREAGQPRHTIDRSLPRPAGAGGAAPGDFASWAARVGIAPAAEVHRSGGTALPGQPGRAGQPPEAADEGRKGDR